MYNPPFYTKKPQPRTKKVSTKPHSTHKSLSGKRVLLIISFLPIAGIFLMSVYAAFSGLSFFGGTPFYGWEAFELTFRAFIIFSAPALIIALIYQIYYFYSQYLKTPKISQPPTPTKPPKSARKPKKS